MIAAETMRLKYMAELNMGQSPPSEDVTAFEEDTLPFLQGNAEFGSQHPQPKHACENPRKIARKGDLLISVRAPVGALNLADRDYGIGRGLCAITWEKCSPRFGWWAIHHCRQQLSAVATGSTYEAVSTEDVGNLRFPALAYEAQNEIASYLDFETSHLDELVAEKEKMLKLLDEKRTALVSRVVTQGIDPGVKMRPSGVEWLGEIPEHWEMHRAKALFDIRDERSEEGGEELLTVSHLTGVTLRSEKDVNMFKAESLIGYKLCGVGDLAINTLWAWMGAMGIVPQEGIVSPDYHVYRLGPKLEPGYVDYLCRSKPFVAEVNRHSKGVWSSRARLYPEAFFNIRFPLPPCAEQRNIVDHLDRELDEAGLLAEALKDSLRLLSMRRTAVIAAAVTGQIDVPGTFTYAQAGKRETLPLAAEERMKYSGRFRQEDKK